MLAALFERCMKRRGVKESDPYDWEKTDAIANSNNTNQGNNLPAQTKNNAEYIHGNVTQMTVAGSNASGTEYVSLYRNKNFKSNKTKIEYCPFVLLYFFLFVVGTTKK